jgi:hypothetical protein
MTQNASTRSGVVAILLAVFMSAAVTYAEPLAGSGKKGRGRSAKEQKLRRDLHLNLDGKGDGFIQGWRWSGAVFTLIIDPARYAPMKVVAATMAARSMFELDGVSLPTKLVIRSTSGEILGEGPFANVPSLVE